MPNVQKKHVCKVYTFRLSFHFCTSPLVVGLLSPINTQRTEPSTLLGHIPWGARNVRSLWHLRISMRAACWSGYCKPQEVRGVQNKSCNKTAATRTGETLCRPWKERGQEMQHLTSKTSLSGKAGGERQELQHYLQQEQEMTHVDLGEVRKSLLVLVADWDFFEEKKEDFFLLWSTSSSPLLS